MALKNRSGDDNVIVFPVFDLSTKRIGFGNGAIRVTTIAYEVRFHSRHVTLLISILIRVLILDPISPSDSNIHCIPHELI